METDNRHLVEKVSQGDRAAFEKLYWIYVNRLYGFVFDLIKSGEVARDIVQEVFIVIWENRENLDPTLSFKSFLFTVAYRRVLNELRRQINSPQFVDYMEFCNQLVQNDENRVNNIDFDLFKRNLQIAKQKLTDRQCEIFNLYTEQGLSVAEISALLKINQQSVRNSLTTSRLVLKKELESYIPIITLLLFALY